MAEKQHIKLEVSFAEFLIAFSLMLVATMGAVTMEMKDYFNERLKFEKAMKALNEPK